MQLLDIDRRCTNFMFEVLIFGLGEFCDGSFSLWRQFMMFTTKQKPGSTVFLEKLIVSSNSQENSPHFLKAEGSSLCTQEPATCSCISNQKKLY